MSDLTVELCFFTGFTDLHAQQPGDLKNKRGGVGGGGGENGSVGGLPII